jgi:hypothetical protein
MKNISDLSVLLGISEKDLKNLEASLSDLVVKRRKRKPGSLEFRYYLSPDKSLLKCQRQITNKILKRHTYPRSVRGLGGRQNSHIATALEHSDSHELVRLDVVNFYDSITAQQVFKVFKDIFGFNDEASKLLTGLTTYEGRLWQGLATSSHLAILCTEEFTKNLSGYADKNEMYFSQYGDDLFFSSKSINATKTASYVIAEAKKFNLNIKRLKISVDRSGTRKVTGSLSGQKGTRAPKNIRKKAELLARLYSRGEVKVGDQLIGYLLFISQCNPADEKKIINKYKLKL